MLNIKSNIPFVVTSLKKFYKNVSDDSDTAVVKIAAAISTHIKERTLLGKDVKGKAFARYSKKTLEYKAKRGGRFFSGKVNLNDKGKMFSAIQYKRVAHNAAIVGITREEEQIKALAHMRGSGKLPKREFFGLNKEEKNKFIKDYKKLVLK